MDKIIYFEKSNIVSYKNHPTFFVVSHKLVYRYLINGEAARADVSVACAPVLPHGFTCEKLIGLFFCTPKGVCEPCVYFLKFLTESNFREDRS